VEIPLIWQAGPTPHNMVSLSTNLRVARKLRGYSRDSLDKLCGFERGTIRRYEMLEAKPNSDELVELSYALHTSTDALLGLRGNRVYDDR